MIPIQITITPTTAGPFNLYSNADSFSVPFETNVPAASLISGYTTSAPDGTTYVRVQSVGDCKNYVDAVLPCSITTTTTTTAVETVAINWELITGEPDNIGFVNLKIFINGIEQVDATISDGNLVESGVINVVPGAIMTATMTNSNLGIWNFGNNILKDLVLYQPQDNCFSCTNSLETSMDSASFIIANTSFIFQGDVNDPTAPPTTTTTSTLPPTTTTTTTAEPIAWSITAEYLDNSAGACADTTYISVVYVENDIWQLGDIVYTDAAKTIPYVPAAVGDQWFHVDTGGAGIAISVKDDGSGLIKGAVPC